MTRLPKILQEFADASEFAAVEKLVENWGGTGIYIPKRLHDKHRLVRVLGWDAAQILCDLYAGEEIDIPLRSTLPLTKKALIVNLATNKNLSNREIAVKVGTTERHVRRVLNAGKYANPSQPKLL